MQFKNWYKKRSTDFILVIASFLNKLTGSHYSRYQKV